VKISKERPKYGCYLVFPSLNVTLTLRFDFVLIRLRQFGAAQINASLVPLHKKASAVTAEASKFLTEMRRRGLRTGLL
jgi:hypothetical protein